MIESPGTSPIFIKHWKTEKKIKNPKKFLIFKEVTFRAQNK